MYPHSLKPTTFGMQVLGRRATRNVIDVSDEQAKRLINGESLTIEADSENGFVLLRWQGFVAGVGFYKRPVLKSQIPRFRPVA
jgi:NOL1/NOP2/fmu family ribosome biogenesis protein